MLKSMKFWNAMTSVALLTIIAGCVAAPPPPPQHPAYLHALSDLRAARWLINHRPGDWQQTNDETEAVRRIDAAINEIKQASVDVGKNLADHPPVDGPTDHRGRIHEALAYLHKARADVSGGETNAAANGWRDRAVGHIDGAIQSAQQVFHE